MDSLSTWYLMQNEDDNIFGPVHFSQLKEWADSAQISPMDKISKDKLSWTKPSFISELEMELLLEIAEDHYYGPTTVGAVQEFLNAGEINRNTVIINCKDGTQKRLKEYKVFRIGEQIASTEPERPGKANIRRSLQKRIIDLEEQLLKERAAFQTLKATYERETGKKYGA